MPPILPALLATISANDAAHVDRASRIALDALTARCRRYVRMYETEARAGMERLVFSENWHGPAVEDVIRSSEQMRRVGSVHKQEAA